MRERIALERIRAIKLKLSTSKDQARLLISGSDGIDPSRSVPHADRQLTTETPFLNGNKGGQTLLKITVFVDLFDNYLCSGRRGPRVL